MGYGVRFQGGHEVEETDNQDPAQVGTNNTKLDNGVSYHDYLQVSFLLLLLLLLIPKYIYLTRMFS